MMNKPTNMLAGVWANCIYEQDGQIYYAFSEKALDVFVKEIVQECSKVILNWKQEPFPFDEKLAVSLIKEHFEIKEY